MPLRAEAPTALSRAHFFFFSKQSIPKFFPIGLSLEKSRVPSRRAHHGQTQKTCSCRSAYPYSTRESIKQRNKEDETLFHGAHKEDPPAASHQYPPPKHSFSSMVLSPPLAPPFRHSDVPLPQHAVFLLGSITVVAMRRAAVALERLADTAREEVPGTMAAVRLSGMEISDLTLELSDLSEEISESVKSSARAVRAAEVGIRRMGSAAASQTLSMLQEHASMPVEAVKPVVANAAETTRQAMSQAHKAVLGLAGMPVLSNWIQKKKLEEQKKIEEGMSLESGEGKKQGNPELMVDS